MRVISALIVVWVLSWPFPALSVPDPPQIRPGLVQALQRRASFTRAHRGPFAARLDGDLGDSAAVAGGWHAGDRVYFAWHQQGDQIVFVAFNPAGQIVLEPHVIGKGRWPRIAADGGRVAVAWNSSTGEGFVVRVHDGKQWGAEIQLAGREAALAFTPAGLLYAVTSTGLWKLSGDHFDRVQEGNYSQPAVAVDKDGTPHTAYRQNGRVVYDGRDVAEGEHPSIIVADGTTHVAYLTKGALVMRSNRGGQWSTPDPIPARKPSWPTLALDSNGGIRLSYIGAADYGPDALWLVRLPDKQPMLLPSLAGNVTDAWVSVKFGLRDFRNNYRPHDVVLTVNGVEVKRFEDTVPEGRYLFRLDPLQVFTSSGQRVTNRVAIHSRHMNPGHYAINSDYQLIVRTDWSEHYVFASNEEEARQSSQGMRVNHDQPDLGIFANVTSLPIEVPKPGRMDIPVMVANLGEASSRPVRLLMLGDKGKVLATTQIPPLEPGADKTVTIPFDYDGTLAQITFRLENNGDFDPSNDSLTLTLWGPKPTAYVGPEPGLPKVPLELIVKLFDENTPPSSYRVVQAFSERMISKVVNGEQFGSLPSGTYRVAVKPYQFEGKEVVFADNIAHQAGVPQTVQINSGIKIEPPQWAGNIWQWSAVDPVNPAKVIQWQSGQHPLMALPPGEYQLTTQPLQFDSQRLVWPQKVRVQADQVTTLKLGSGVRIEMPKETVGPLWHWAVVPYGKPDEVIQWHDTEQRAMLVPPGEYQVAVWPTQFDSQRLVWPQKVRVQADQVATLKLDTGIRLAGPAGAKPHFEFRVLDEKKAQVQWGRQTWGGQLIPPGTYSVEIRAGSFGPWKTLAENVVVRQGQITEVKVPGLPQ